MDRMIDEVEWCVGEPPDKGWDHFYLLRLKRPVNPPKLVWAWAWECRLDACEYRAWAAGWEGETDPGKVLWHFASETDIYHPHDVDRWCCVPVIRRRTGDDDPAVWVRRRAG